MLTHNATVVRLSPVLLAILLLGVAVPARAQTAPVDLGVATLEDLMNIEITSASRKEQRAGDVPAAVYIITRDDIRRSGMTTVPDLLRLVPGVQVAQINASKWAVSVRGFNNLASNKVLVLVDGRSIYNPLFASVFWDTEDLMLEDVDRIEVIRGPGGAVWGANAVNGVINIITRPATDTPGLLVRAGAGTFDGSGVAIRYGGATRQGAYRSYAQLSTHGGSVGPPGVADDHWLSGTGGFRGDWAIGPEAFMLQSSVAAGQERPLWMSLDPTLGPQARSGGVSETQVANVLGRWTRTRVNGATLQLQSFVDLAHRREAIGNYQRGTGDLDAVYHTSLGRRHDLVLGGGYRYIREAMDGGTGYRFIPNRAQQHLVNAFAQDEIALAGRRIVATLGAKVEQATGVGASLEPTARLMWHFAPAQHLWGAVAKAVRTPSLIDRGIQIDYPAAVRTTLPGDPAAGIPVAVSVRGNPAVQNERLISTEAGYRLDIGSRAVVDLTGFVGRYQHLQTAEPSAPSLTFSDARPVIDVTATTQNLLDAETRGAEISARVTLSSAWRLDGAFSVFDLTPHPDAASHDPIAAAADGDAPAYQWRGHSALSLGPRAKTDVLLFYVGPLVRLAIPAYTRADVRVEWALTSRLSAVVQAQNLLSASHPEFLMDPATMVSTRVPRSARAQLVWRP
ncbi:MAG: TonB-dependent receptor [Acidobacteriota bacterium]